MKTIEKTHQIDNLLKFIDESATKAISEGLTFTVECRTDGITEKQFNAMHAWIRMCVKYLNEGRNYRRSPLKGVMVPWTEKAFKEDVYKLLLKAWKNKPSTKNQNTKDPEDIRLALTAHLSTEYGDIILPPWPSLRG